MSITTHIEGLPVVDRAGFFQLLNPVFEFTYRNPTNVIHLYDYHGRVRIGSKEYTFSPGDITCIQSGSVYSFSTEAPGKHWCIHYTEIPTEGLGALKLPSHLQLGANSLFYREQLQLISRLFNSHQSGDNPIQLEARYRLKALLLALHNLSVSRSSGKRSRSNFSWDNLLEWIDAHLDQPLTVPLIAERANLAPGTLTKKFKQAHKTTLSQYLLHRRIDKAKSLLATTTLTVYEVGSNVGIPDPQYFNKQFRKVTGNSPSRYRDDNQEYLSNIPNELSTKEGRWQE
jgi:AraC family transcriptional regulator